MIVWNIGTTTNSPMHAGKYIGTFDFHYKFEIVALTMGLLKKLKPVYIIRSGGNINSIVLVC